MEKKKRKREGKKNFRRKLRGNTAYRGQCGMENFRKYLTDLSAI